jgi:hypothetical protein
MSKLGLRAAHFDLDHIGLTPAALGRATGSHTLVITVADEAGEYDDEQLVCHSL